MEVEARRAAPAGFTSGTGFMTGNFHDGVLLDWCSPHRDVD